ncbi:hypothetical protein ZWY2020_018567 [Hordeum vulgare]|nr:hypothetical protein ZWY2020_018567 [Hordeum vulgare]
MEEGEGQESRYWCHSCEEVIVPVEPEKKCPDCDGGFVEEMGSEGFEPSTNMRSERNLSLWAPLLLGMMGGTFGPSDNQENSSNTSTGVSLGDYFLGPGLDMLLQRLADSDLNRSGTPPAKKESVAALPTVNIQEVLGCTVCLEEFEMGTAKEMPCQHKFHSNCILPWLELHSSCPICRFQLPTEESKNPCESGSGGGTVSADGDHAESSNSDIGTDHDGGSVLDRPDVTSALNALFGDASSSSSSDENGPGAPES